MNKMKVQFIRSSLMLAMVALAGPTAANPLVNSLEGKSGEHVANETVVTIYGSGFGHKKQAAPVLFDRQTKAYENGVLNDFFSSLDDGEAIPTSRGGEERSPWGRATSRVFMDRGMSRHEGSEGAYALKGQHSWLGLPVAYGGVEGWDTPTDERYLYVSWRYKVTYNSSYYWRFVPHDVSGEFVEGENLIIEGELRGKFIGIDDDGNVNAVFYGERNNNFLADKKMEGEQSGSSMRFPYSRTIDGEIQFWRPGTKYIRKWDDPDSGGIRTSISDTAYVVAHHPDRDKGSGSVFDRINVSSGKWHHFEVKLDMEQGTMKTWFNGRLREVAEFDPSAAYEGKYSPTIALMGNNDPQERLQRAWLSDIYMDNTPQRVILANESKADEIENYEVQMLQEWSSDEIVVSLNLGELSADSDLYLYVYDEIGGINSEGIPVCEFLNCGSAPVPTELSVE